MKKLLNRCKRMAALLFAVCMALSLLPGTARAEEQTLRKGELYVGGIDIVEAGGIIQTPVPGTYNECGYAELYYGSDGNPVLKLYEYHYNGGAGYSDGTERAAIHFTGIADLTIDIQGNSCLILKPDGCDELPCSGIYTADFTSTLTITGDSKLEITVGNADAVERSCGVHTAGNLRVMDDCSLISRAGNAGGDSYGVYAEGALEVRSAELAGYGGAGENSYGVRGAKSVNLCGGANVRSVGGAATCCSYGLAADYNGISVAGDVAGLSVSGATAAFSFSDGFTTGCSGAVCPASDDVAGNWSLLPARECKYAPYELADCKSARFPCSQTITVTYDPGEDLGKVEPQSFPKGHEARLRNLTVPDGYVFCGWFTARGAYYLGMARLSENTHLGASVALAKPADAGQLNALLSSSKDPEKPAVVKLEQDFNLFGLGHDLIVHEDCYAVIDLNGHTIDRGLTSIFDARSSGGVISVFGTLRLTDSSDDPATPEYDGRGRLTGGKCTPESNLSSDISAGGVTVGSTGTFIMDGGSIEHNAFTPNGDNAGGGGVCVYYGTFIMNGGSIHHNTARPPAFSGGGVHVYNGTFIMNGGSIEHNLIDQILRGGGLYAFSSSFTMNGGTISGNYGTTAVFLYNCEFNMTGGTISNNYRTNVELSESTLNVSGSPTICDHGRTNVSKRTDSLIRVVGDLTGGAIGVSGGDKIAELADASFVCDAAARFLPDDENYAAVRDPESNAIMRVPGHVVRFLNDGKEVFRLGIANGACAAEPEEPSPPREGLVFLGWYNGDTRYIFSTPVEEHLTLRAVWSPSVSGSYDAEHRLIASVAASVDCVLIAAEYEGQSGALLRTAVIPVTADTNPQLLETGFTAESGKCHALMLVDGKTFAPLCAAWSGTNA